MQRVEYAGWPNCVRLSNQLVDLVVTTDVGPRIIRFGFVDRPNEFAELASDLGKTGGEDFRLYGGHRLWHSPEVIPRTYHPDNEPLAIEIHSDFLRVIQPIEKGTGIAKEMDIRLAADLAWVRVTHRLYNHNVWAVRLAPWALSMMAPGGVCVMPLPPRGDQPDNLLRISTITLWGFTNMADPRWTWGSRYIMLRQDPTVEIAQKVGLMTPEGWIAYARAGHLLTKRTAYLSDACYPDLGCCLETYANADFLEIETLGPLVELEPGTSVEHTEDWFLFDSVPMPTSEADVDRFVLPHVRETDDYWASQSVSWMRP